MSPCHLRDSPCLSVHYVITLALSATQETHNSRKEENVNNEYEFISFTFLQSVDITPLLCDVDKKDKSGMARLKV